MAPRTTRAATPATEALRRSGIAFTTHEYDVADGGRRRERVGYGEAAAAALGVDPARIFKTLVASVDGRLVAAVVPVAAELDLKRLAAAAGGHRAELADAAAAERASGSVIGGISPIGMRRPLPTWADESIGRWPAVMVSAGRRGLQVELAPSDLVAVTRASVAAIARRD
jgi:Cys-tRNA(Pro)/Cys-tRNA(Cys) deacylase